MMRSIPPTPTLSHSLTLSLSQMSKRMRKRVEGAIFPLVNPINPGQFFEMPAIPNLRSPKEKLAGWIHLPRFVDKIRLHTAGKLPPEYQANFCKGFDGYWLDASGVNKDSFVEFVKKAKNDSEVEQWVQSNVRKTSAEIEAFNQRVLNRGRNDDTSDRVKQRKAESGFADREDIQTFVDLIEADEGRL
jgi:hypothetical protein